MDVDARDGRADRIESILMSLLATLLDMHTYCRPAGTETERAFIAKYIAVLPGAYQDHYRNWHVQIGESNILWSCHTDTVHNHEGRQTLHYDAVNQVLCLSRKSKHHSSLRTDSELFHTRDWQ